MTSEPLREQQMTFKVTAVELEEIKAAAKLSGETAAGWCRDLVLRAARGKKVEVRSDNLDWLRAEVARLQALNVEVLRTLLEHTRHESPTAEIAAREAADRKLGQALQRLNSNHGPEGSAAP